jgi:hypothetical protein
MRPGLMAIAGGSPAESVAGVSMEAPSIRTIGRPVADATALAGFLTQHARRAKGPGGVLFADVDRCAALPGPLGTDTPRLDHVAPSELE